MSAAVPARPSPADLDIAVESLPSAVVWEKSYLVTFPATVVVLLVAGADLARSAGAALITVLLGATYALLRRRLDAFGGGYRREMAIAFQVCALVAVFAALCLEFWSGLLLCALCPMAYLTLGVRLGHVQMVLLCLAPTLGGLVRTGDLVHSLTRVLPWSLASIVFSLFVARAITKVELRSAERAALVAELKATRAEAARLAREAGAVQERRRIAGDLHDTVAQGLNSIALLVEAADRTLESEPELAHRHLTTAGQVARDHLQETRAMVGALKSGPLQGSTLIEALHRLSDRADAEAGLQVAVDLPNTLGPVPNDIAVTLLRVAQEAVNNVRKHAGTTQAWIRLEHTPGVLVLEIRDDGQGFDPSTRDDGQTGGHGLDGMRDRATAIGGRFTVSSMVGSGTQVRVELET